MTVRSDCVVRRSLRWAKRKYTQADESSHSKVARRRRRRYGNEVESYDAMVSAASRSGYLTAKSDVLMYGAKPYDAYNKTGTGTTAGTPIFGGS
jgi:hypothetical protein